MNKENMALRGYVIHLRITTDSVSVRVLQREREREPIGHTDVCIKHVDLL